MIRRDGRAIQIPRTTDQVRSTIPGLSLVSMMRMLCLLIFDITSAPPLLPVVPFRYIGSLEAKVDFLQRSLELFAGQPLSGGGPPVLSPLHPLDPQAPAAAAAAAAARSRGASKGHAIAVRLAATAAAAGGAVAGGAACEKQNAGEDDLEDLIENLNQVPLLYWP